MAKILIIDDDVFNRQALKLTLEKAGHVVTEAGDGEEGLSAAQKNPPDLIFLDVVMPKMAGWEVCSALKKCPQTTRIPIIMLTTCDKQADAYQGFQLGTDEYLTKPWTPARALEAVARLLSNRPYELPEEAHEESKSSNQTILKAQAESGT